MKRRSRRSPSAAIAGVPRQFDEFTSRATRRDPGDRYADAAAMGADLHRIVDELGLPPFRVPAPRNSAQHVASAEYHSRIHHDDHITTAHAPAAPQQPISPPRQHTREMTRGVDDRENRFAAGHFAGIGTDELEWARQRGRRVGLFWLVGILTLTGLVAAGAWALGSNLQGLF